jgi:hypothetical protein
METVPGRLNVARNDFGGKAKKIPGPIDSRRNTSRINWMVVRWTVITQSRSALFVL